MKKRGKRYMKEIIWLVSGIGIGILLSLVGLAALGVTFSLADYSAWQKHNEPKNDEEDADQLKPCC
jgi:O-antigen/teichoic acid export membrane protein